MLFGGERAPLPPALAASWYTEPHVPVWSRSARLAVVSGARTRMGIAPPTAGRYSRPCRGTNPRRASGTGTTGAGGSGSDDTRPGRRRTPVAPEPRDKSAPVRSSGRARFRYRRRGSGSEPRATRTGAGPDPGRAPLGRDVVEPRLEGATGDEVDIQLALPGHVAPGHPCGHRLEGQPESRGSATLGTVVELDDLIGGHGRQVKAARAASSNQVDSWA